MFDIIMAVQPTYGGGFAEIPRGQGKNKDTVFVITAYPPKLARVAVYLRTVGRIQ